MSQTQKITTFLWYDGKAEEAARFYMSVFPDARITSIMPGPDGKVLTVTFELAGQQYVAMNGGPGRPFTEAISLLVSCETQEEIDRLWEALTADGGKPVQCGWLRDRYGLSWQIVPHDLLDMLADADRTRAGRVWEVMIRSVKFDIAELKAAWEGD